MYISSGYKKASHLCYNQWEPKRKNKHRYFLSTHAQAYVHIYILRVFSFAESLFHNCLKVSFLFLSHLLSFAILPPGSGWLCFYLSFLLSHFCLPSPICPGFSHFFSLNQQGWIFWFLYHFFFFIIHSMVRTQLSLYTCRLLYTGEGNGKTLQYSCLENPMDVRVGRVGCSPWGCY